MLVSVLDAYEMWGHGNEARVLGQISRCWRERTERKGKKWSETKNEIEVSRAKQIMNFVINHLARDRHLYIYLC